MGEKSVSEAHVAAIMGDESELRMDEALDAAGEGDFSRLDKRLAQLWAAGTQPVAVLRQAMGHFQRLMAVRAEADEGGNLSAAIKKLRPPVHFSRERSVQAQASRWSLRAARSGARYSLRGRSPGENHRRTCRSRVRPRAALGRGARRQRALTPMLKVRIIPCLDVKDGRVVKGVNFVSLRDAGDPVEQAILYDAAGADELCFLDITASHEKRPILLDVVRRTASACFMPLTVGGGVRTLDDIRALLLSGADKVSINTEAVRRPEIIREGAEKFGSQCIVAAIDAKRVGGRFEIFTHGGRNATGIDAVEHAVKLTSLARAKFC